MKYLLIVTFIYFANVTRSVSQIIHIKLIDSSSNAINLAYVKHYCSTESPRHSDYQTVRSPVWPAQINLACRRIIIEVLAPGYDDYIQEIEMNHSMNDTLLCRLSRSKIKYLDPVIVTAKSNPIQVRSDTTIFTMKAFSDGTESKLIDLLETLRGFDFNKKNGEIRFKGKPIETILLEGDNLFGSNYTLGTKNINADIVTEVQAIENYSENYILKELENEGNVALNIKLSKSNTKFRISGNSEVELGLQENENRYAANIHANLLGFGSAHKFFSTLSHNNIGHNYAPADFSGNNSSVEQLKDKIYAAQTFIQEPSFHVVNNKNYNNINNQLFGNHNTLFKLSPKITLKGTIYAQNDRISNEQLFENNYFSGNDTVTTTDRITGEKKPIVLKWDAHLRYAISSNAMLEATLSDTREHIQSFRICSSNYIQNYQTRLRSEDRFKKFIVTYTQRISKTQAMQVDLRSTLSSIDQIFNIIPSASNTTLFNIPDNQSSNYNRNYTHLKTTLFGVVNKIKYNFYIKYTLDNNNYFSSLTNAKNPLLPLSQNNINYKKPLLSHGGAFHYTLKKLHIAADYQLFHLQQKWINQSNGKQGSKSHLYMEPCIKLKYTLTKLSSLFINYSYTFKNINDQYLFPEIVVQNFRNATYNKTELKLIETSLTSFNYSRIDLYNQFDYGISLTIQSGNSDYLPQYTITDSLFYTMFSFQPLRNKFWDTYLYINKYIPLLKSFIKVSANNTINYYYNFLTTDVLRDNKTKSLTIQLFIKTAFIGKLNFETDNMFTRSQSKNQFNNSISNHYFTSYARILFNPNKRIKMFLAGDYYRPNLNYKSNALFMNYMVSYKPAKSNIELKLSVNNITNTQNLIQFQISDFSRSMFRTNTLPRNIMLYCAFRF